MSTILIFLSLTPAPVFRYITTLGMYRISGIIWCPARNRVSGWIRYPVSGTKRYPVLSDILYLVKSHIRYYPVASITNCCQTLPGRHPKNDWKKYFVNLIKHNFSYFSNIDLHPAIKQMILNDKEHLFFTNDQYKFCICQVPMQLLFFWSKPMKLFTVACRGSLLTTLQSNHHKLRQCWQYMPWEVKDQLAKSDWLISMYRHLLLQVQEPLLIYMALRQLVNSFATGDT